MQQTLRESQVITEESEDFFFHWCLRYLKHSYLMEEGASTGQLDSVKVFNVFFSSFKSFEKVLGMLSKVNELEVEWTIPIIDQMMELLVCHAEEADIQSQ